MKITKGVLEEAISAYDECVPMAEIASWVGVSRQGLWKALRRAGVETRKGVATRRKLVCDNCGKEYEVTRSRYRLLGKKRFCADVCYHMYLGNRDSYANRHLQRVAREKVSKVFDLQEGNVVHHEDSKHWNTHFSNLKVFKSNADHVKYHHQKRQGEVTVSPIWDGVEYLEGASVADRIRDKFELERMVKHIELDGKENVKFTGYFNPVPKGK